MSLKFFLIVGALLVVGCSNGGSSQDNSANPPQTTQSQPAPYPIAKGNWTEVRTFIERRESNPAVCDYTDFKVESASGNYRVTRCDFVRTGRLSSDEFKQLDSLTTEAYSQTTSEICPQIFKLDQYYGTINSNDTNLSRHFDPDGSCYKGNEAAVTNFKTFLQQLLTEYDQ